VIESQTKAKSKITWRRQASDPLGKGNSSTHPRQNYAQAKSANHQTQTRKPQRDPLHTCKLPLNQCNSPCTIACKIPLEIGQLQQLSAQPWPVRPVNPTGQTGAQHVNRTSTLTGQTGDLNRSDRCTPEPKNGSKPPKYLLNASSNQFKLKLLPLVNNAWIKPKMQKNQPKASQIDKIQHRMLHMSKWAS
jgi:hypothetical protein